MNISMKTPRTILVSGFKTVLTTKINMVFDEMADRSVLYRKVPRRKRKKNGRTCDGTQKLSDTVENESKGFDDSDQEKCQGDIRIEQATSDAEEKPSRG
jgi:hypothetical protein